MFVPRMMRNSRAHQDVIMFLAAIGAYIFLFSSCDSRKDLVPGAIIREDVVYKPGDYNMDSPDSLDKASIIIKGNHITVDFGGATIWGDDLSTAPNHFSGVGILIDGGENITIRNLNIRGYKIGLLARDVRHLVIENSNFSYQYRPRMGSIREREDIADWLSYHDNEASQWMRYGAGLYLDNCDYALIRNNIASQNQNAMLMVGSDSCLVYNNRFAFNSGLGLGMYRSSHNQIKHNCLDFNVRGYSHGFYRRGQDSAGLLVYQQSNNNDFSYNSATHSGDGFFLWAGQYTMDTGEGGCNNNIIAHNDFSFAPTNGIEVTFSSNTIINNSMVDCRYGIWAGYSHHTDIYFNEFKENVYGIAFEHGNNNRIAYNQFQGDSIGIMLWERASQPEEWGFSKYRDVSSRSYRISSNNFNDVHTPLDIRNTAEVYTREKLDVPQYSVSPMEDGIDATAVYNMEGRDKILVNEWGPYNYEYPLVWLSKIEDDQYALSLLGPQGSWSVTGYDGFSEISRLTGSLPDTLVVRKNMDAHLLLVEFEYLGNAFVDQFGKSHASDKPYTFAFRRFEMDIDWTVQWINYEDRSDPLKEYSVFKHLLRQSPIVLEKTPVLSYNWWRAPHEKIRNDRFGTFAYANVDVEKGKYVITLTSDDGIRFFIDGRLVIDHWNIHEPANDSTHVQLDGQHRFEIEHFDGGGFSTLAFKMDKL